jgi:cytochrome c553
MRTLVPLGLLAGLALAGAACSSPAAAPPYNPQATVLQLMEGPIAHGAEEYWNSVSTIVDKDGVHENFPKTDEEWEHVWSGAITIAESGNLLMMPSRARDDGDWMKFSAQLVEVGMAAAKAAEDKNKDKVLEEGGNVYTVCTACHEQYIVDAADPLAPQPSQ